MLVYTALFGCFSLRAAVVGAARTVGSTLPVAAYVSGVRGAVCVSSVMASLRNRP